jgi:predicted nucleotidyltransferase
MLTQTIVEKKINDLKPILKEKYFVNKIGYFGSYARGTANENSDLDILVEFSQPLGWEFFDLQDLLEKNLDVKIDLVSSKALKSQLKEIILKEVKYL